MPRTFHAFVDCQGVASIVRAVGAPPRRAGVRYLGVVEAETSDEALDKASALAAAWPGR